MAYKGGSARRGYLPPQICKELELSFDAREIISVRPHTRGGGGGGPIMVYRGRLYPKRVLFSGFRYMKG